MFKAPRKRWKEGNGVFEPAHLAYRYLNGLTRKEGGNSKRKATVQTSQNLSISKGNRLTLASILSGNESDRYKNKLCREVGAGA
jgi:hypothetical protein